MTAAAPVLSAVQQIRRMRGGSQSQLMRASDGAYYVVKFANSPQGIRILANEMFATRLGLWLGLPMPQVEVIEVSDWLVAHSPDLRIEVGGNAVPRSSGLQLASRYVADPAQDIVFDYLPETLMLSKTENPSAFVSVLPFDKWTGNADGRQAVFSRNAQARKFTIWLIDHGYCFNAEQWDFPDPLCAVSIAGTRSMSKLSAGNRLNRLCPALSRSTTPSFGDWSRVCLRIGTSATPKVFAD
jgi:hypothetical protein